MGERGLRQILDALTPPSADGGIAAQLDEQARKVRARMASVSRKVFVMSGKGGVGKSAVTRELAAALARRGRKVGVLDADLNGPCMPSILGMSGIRWKLEGRELEPAEGPLGLRVASTAFLLEEAEPLRWNGPQALAPVWLGTLEMNVLRELLADVRWGTLDILLVDLPPGAAADKPPALLRHVPELDGAVVVTTRSRAAREVVARALGAAQGHGIAPLGLVENMSGYRCGACGEVGPLFPSDGPLGGDVPWLARLPFDPEFAASLDAGRLLPPDHAICRAMDAAAARLEDRLARGTPHPPPQSFGDHEAPEARR